MQSLDAVNTTRLPSLAGEVLTDRESQTLTLIADGLCNKQIARELGISAGTVKIYVGNLLRKLRLASRLELATWMHRGQGNPAWHGAAPAGAGLGHAPIEGGQVQNVPALLERLPGFVYRGANDRRWHMEYVSAGSLAVTGYAPEQLGEGAQQSFGSLILEQYSDYVWQGVQQALREGRPYQLNYPIRCADGGIKRVWETGVGRYGANGRVLGVEGAIFEQLPV